MKGRKYRHIWPLLLLCLINSTVTAGDRKREDKLFCVESTAYWEGEVTASGEKVREGICAGKPEWLGLTCIVYEDDNGETGDYIGIYEMLDTGSDSRLKDGSCIDFYLKAENDCWEWGRRKVWIQLIDAKG